MRKVKIIFLPKGKIRKEDIFRVIIEDNNQTIAFRLDKYLAEKLKEEINKIY